MKIACQCGATIFDQGSYKAHFVPDLNWDALLETIDRAIESNAAISKDARCMAVRKAIAKATRPAWQCRSCGSLYFGDETAKLRSWSPAEPAKGVRLFEELET